MGDSFGGVKYTRISENFSECLESSSVRNLGSETPLLGKGYEFVWYIDHGSKKAIVFDGAVFAPEHDHPDECVSQRNELTETFNQFSSLNIKGEWQAEGERKDNAKALQMFWARTRR